MVAATIAEPRVLPPESGVAHRSPDPDAGLLRLALEGDQGAARAFVARRLPPLVSLAERMLDDRAEAEDVAQEAIERVWSNPARWRREARLSTYLYAVALNACRDRLRRRRTVPLARALDRAGSADPEAEVGRLETARRVRRALAALPERQRAAIVLSYYEQMSNPETARVMGVGVRAVESMLARARRRLRELLMDEEPEK